MNVRPPRTRSRFSILLCSALIAVAASGCGSSSPISPSPPGLAVTAVSPSSVTTAGGTTVTVAGTGFSAGTTLLFDGIPATNLTLTGSTTISATTPAHTAGTVSVVAISGGQSASFSGTFTYVAPSGANAPPVISSMTTTGGWAGQPAGFADIANPVTVTAAVSDIETPLSQLAYSWTATAGTFTGSGVTVTWTAPATLSTSPTAVTLTLKVTEAYIENGVAQVNTASSSVTLSVHDSQKEVLDLGQDFLERFSQTAAYPNAQDVVRNFSPTCEGGPGAGGEYDDVANNRISYVITSWYVRPQPPVTFNFHGECMNPLGTFHADACSSFAVHWEDTMKAPDPRHPERTVGSTGQTTGVDYVTAVLESDRWRLCESSYLSNPAPSPLIEALSFLIDGPRAFFTRH